MHHTDNPYEAFRCLIPNLKKGGYIFVGLYNKFGRFRKINKAFPPPKRMRDKTIRRKRSFLIFIDKVVFTFNYATN